MDNCFADLACKQIVNCETPHIPITQIELFSVNIHSCQRRTMQNHLLTSSCALVALVAVQSTASFAQDPTIGNATATKNRVEGLVGSTTQSISKGTSVYNKEVGRTGSAG